MVNNKAKAGYEMKKILTLKKSDFGGAFENVKLNLVDLAYD